MPEYTVKPGSSPLSNFTSGYSSPFGGGLSTKTVDRTAPSERAKVVIYNEVGGAGVEIDPNGLNASEFAAAVSAAKFGRAVTPSEFRTSSLVNSKPLEVEPTPVLPASSPLAMTNSPAPEPEVPMSETINVQFERSNGDTVVASYSEIVDDGNFLTLVYDHSQKPGVLYRPGASEELIYISVEAHKGKPEKVYSCYATGYRVKFKNYELIAFVIEQEKDV